MFQKEIKRTRTLLRMTISDKTILFNTMCLKKLPEASHILLLINPDRRMIAVKASKPSAKNALRWLSPRQKPAPVYSLFFCDRIYEMMQWDRSVSYSIVGTSVEVEGKVLLFFDLEHDAERIEKEGRWAVKEEKE